VWIYIPEKRNGENLGTPFRSVAMRLKRRVSTAGFIIAIYVVVLSASVNALTEPEAPRSEEPLSNGFQLGFYSGISYNIFGGAYDGQCPCIFLGDGSSTSIPYGFDLNIPVFSDAALYLRAGWQNTSTGFFVGRTDSLRSIQAVGEIGDGMTLFYDLAHFDVLVRLIGKQDGERVFLGPSFGWVQQKRIRIIESEYETGKRFLLQDKDIADPINLRYSFVLGAEYAFVPFRELYIIPSLQVDYSLQKISTLQPLKPNFYKFLVSVAYQPF